VIGESGDDSRSVPGVRSALGLSGPDAGILLGRQVFETLEQSPGRAGPVLRVEVQRRRPEIFDPY